MIFQYLLLSYIWKVYYVMNSLLKKTNTFWCKQITISWKVLFQTRAKVINMSTVKVLDKYHTFNIILSQHAKAFFRLLSISWSLLVPRNSMPFVGLTKISLEDGVILEPPPDPELLGTFKVGWLGLSFLTKREECLIGYIFRLQCISIPIETKWAELGRVFFYSI